MYCIVCLLGRSLGQYCLASDLLARREASSDATVQAQPTIEASTAPRSLAPEFSESAGKLTHADVVGMLICGAEPVLQSVELVVEIRLHFVISFMRVERPNVLGSCHIKFVHPVRRSAWASMDTKSCEV
jgi:hypothetical protein